MTEREREILEIIRENPSISQKEISERLNISANTVAVHISNLTKEGFLLGKAYIVKEEDYAVGIGAANADLYGKSFVPLKTHFDHPAAIRSTVGGVTRNILDNLSRLGVHTKLLSAVGDDIFGEMILRESAKKGIDVSDVLTVKNASSGVFMQVLDEDNDMHMALCDMSIIGHITPTYLKEKEKVLQGAKVIAFDPSLPLESIEYLIEHYSDKTLFVDPISDLYAEKIRPYADKIFALKPNRTELGALTGMEVRDKKDVKKAAKKLIENGTKRVYVSMGKDGCLYMDENTCIERKLPEEKVMVNASGAGDAFYAGIIYGYMNDLPIKQCLDLALAAGTLTIRSEEVISPLMSVIELERIVKEKKQ